MKKLLVILVIALLLGSCDGPSNKQNHKYLIVVDVSGYYTDSYTDSVGFIVFKPIKRVSMVFDHFVEDMTSTEKIIVPSHKVERIETNY